MKELAPGKAGFQGHAAGRDGAVVLSRTLSRGHVLSFLIDLPKCMAVLEACASAHRRRREIVKLAHEVRAIPPGLR